MVPALYFIAGLVVLLFCLLSWIQGDFRAGRRILGNNLEDALEIAEADEYGKIDKDKEPFLFYWGLLPVLVLGLWLIYKAFSIKFGHREIVPF